MSRTAFLVVRRALAADGTGCEDQFLPDTGSRVPLRLFASRAAAEGYCAALVAVAQRAVSPFTQLGGVVTNDEASHLAALGFPVECPNDSWHEDWRLWWDTCQDLITDEQRAAAWAILGGKPPFEVQEVEVDE